MEGIPKGKAGSKQRDKVKDHCRGQEEESEDIFAHFSCFSRRNSTWETPCHIPNVQRRKPGKKTLATLEPGQGRGLEAKLEGAV